MTELVCSQIQVIKFLFFSLDLSRNHILKFLISPVLAAFVSFSLFPLSPVLKFSSGRDELWIGLLGRRRLLGRTAQRNGVPRSSAVSVRPSLGPLLFFNKDLLQIYAEYPWRSSQWLEAWCCHCQLVCVGYFKVDALRHSFFKGFNVECISFNKDKKKSCKNTF